MNAHIRSFPLLLLGVLCSLIGCNKQVSETAKLTSSNVRAARRAYDGSPPVIPHEPLGAACVTCHTETGKLVPNMAFAPANPHGQNGSLQNCRQCHLFKRGNDEFTATEFVALSVQPKRGDRLFPGAPPTIPHTTLMRSNCAACHAGPSARPEIRCTHPERSNCMQCHVPKAVDTEFAVRTDNPNN